MPAEKVTLPLTANSIEEARNISLERVPTLAVPSSVLMCEPKFFDVLDAKNEFMARNVGAVDRQLAQAQWQKVKATFEELGYPVETIEPAPQLEDMVFCANQVLPGKNDDGTSFVLMAEMVHPSRQREVPFFETWFRERGYAVRRFPQANSQPLPRFEGQGDAIWHHGKKLLWIGYGQRTEEAACQLVAETLRVPVIKLHLPSKEFYHLDTCFCMLSEDAVMIYPKAFDQQGLTLIRQFFKQVVEVSEKDANNFACNALALGRKVVLQQGSSQAMAKLREIGFEPIEVDTSEFMKSGGSVFCMKMMIY